MLRSNSGLRENVGAMLSKARTPLTSLSQGFRESRLFHPAAIYFHAKVRPVHNDLNPALRPLAERLSGDSLIRFAAGLWRAEHNRLPDLLSCCIRFKAWQPMEVPTPDAQDLVLTSARSPWTLALDSIRTDQHDFLANQYHSAWPYQADDHARIELRLQPLASSAEGDNRFDRLRHAVKQHDAHLLLEARDTRLSPTWQPLVEIRLMREVEVDQSQLFFSPFRDGQGLRPMGFIQYLRPLPSMLGRFVGQQAATVQAQAQEATSQLSDQARDTVEEIQKTAKRGATRATKVAQETGHMAREMSALAAEEASRATRGKTSRASSKSSQAQSSRKGSEVQRPH